MTRDGRWPSDGADTVGGAYFLGTDPLPTAAAFGGPSITHENLSSTSSATFGTATRLPRHDVDAAAESSYVPVSSLSWTTPSAQDARVPAKRAPQHGFPTAKRANQAIAAASNDTPLAHDTSRRHIPAAATFGKEQRNNSLSAGVTADAPLLPAELPRTLRPGKPSARFATAEPRPTTVREDARPELHPEVALDAVKPRAHSGLTWVPPTCASSAAAAAATGAASSSSAAACAAAVKAKAPNPASYTPSLELVTRRAPSASIAPLPSHGASGKKTKSSSRPRSPSPPPPPTRPKDAVTRAQQAAAPFSSSAPRGCLVFENAEAEGTDARAPFTALSPAVEAVKPAAPAFSFGKAARVELPLGGGPSSSSSSRTKARSVEEEEEEEGGGEEGEGAYAEGGAAAEEFERRYSLVERRVPAATFGSAPRFFDEVVKSRSAMGERAGEGGEAGGAPPPTADHPPPEAPTTPPRRTVRGGAIGRAPRFPDDKEALHSKALAASLAEAGEAPTSPTASTVLSDAATDVASIGDVEGAAARVRPRAPSALIMPERSHEPSSRQRRQAIAAARLGPGAYAVSTGLVERRVPGASFGPPPKQPTMAVDAPTTPDAASASAASTPGTLVRSRRRAQALDTPGPGTYAPKTRQPPPPKVAGAAWSKLTGREPSADNRRRAESAVAVETAASTKARAELAQRTAAAAAAAKAAAKRFALPPAPDATDVVRRRTGTGAARFSTVPRDSPFGAPPTAGGESAAVPFYEVNHSFVERNAVGGSFAKGETDVNGRSLTRKARGAPRRIELLRNWRMKRQQLERLLNGEFDDAETTTGPSAALPKAPADATRGRVRGGFVYRIPSKLAPQHARAKARRHPAVSPHMEREAERHLATTDLLAKHKRWIQVRAESFSFGKAAQYPEQASSGQYSDAEDAADSLEYSAAAAEARLELGFPRAPSALWGRMRTIRLLPPMAEEEAGTGDVEEGGSTRRRGGWANPRAAEPDESDGGAARSAFWAALRRQRMARDRLTEGDTLTLEVLKAQFYARPLRVQLPGFRMLLPTTTPRKALVPRPPWPPPPLAPVLLLPPSKMPHVPTAHLAPKLHRERPRVGEWGWAGLPGAPPETADVDYLSIEEVDTATMRTMRSVRGGVIGTATRFEVISAAARLLPEGCVLELHPSWDAVLPHHGVLVNMRLDSQAVHRGPPDAYATGVELLTPGPDTYRPSLALTKPSAPSAVDIGRAFNPRGAASDLLDGTPGSNAVEVPSAATYDVEIAWDTHAVGRRAPRAFFGTEPRPIGDAPGPRSGGGPLGEGELLSLVPAATDEASAARQTGRPMRHDGTGGAISLDRQVGRLPPPTADAHEILSGGDYDANDRPTRHRWPVVDFGSAPERPELFAHEAPADRMLDLEPNHDAVLQRAPAVDFGSGPHRDAPRGDGADHTPDALGNLLELYPQPEVVLPSHPTTVMKRDPRQPRTRPRRWPVVRSEHDKLCDEIEAAILAAGPPVFDDETGGSRQL